MTDIKEKQVGKYFIFSTVLGKGANAMCKKGCEVNDPTKLVAVKIIDKAML